MINSLQAQYPYIWEAGDKMHGKLVIPKEDGTFTLEESELKHVPMMKFGVMTVFGDLRSFEPYCLPCVKPIAIRLARA